MSDGSLKFDTKIDTSGLKKGTKDINKELSGVEKIADRVKTTLKNAFKLSKKDTTVEIEYAAQHPQSFFQENIKDEQYAIESINQELETARAKLQELQGLSKFGNVPGLKDQIAQATAEVNKYEQALAQSQTNLQANQQWLQQRVEIDACSKKVSELQAKMDRMNAVGVKPTSTSYKNLQYDLANAQAKLKTLQYGIDSSGVNAQNMATQFAAAGSTVTKAADQMADSIGKKLPKATKRASNSMKFFSRMIISMLVMQAVMSLMRQFTEGIQEMAKACPDVNANLSEIMSSLTYLRNSFAAAFAPLISIVVPVINTICGALATLIQYISQVIAVLTGSSTYKVAIKQQKDYAKSLEGTGSAAKGAEKALAGFDEINQLNLSSSSGGGGGADTGGAFADLPVSSALADQVNKALDSVYKTLKKIASIFKKGFFKGLGDSWQEQVSDILSSLSVIKDQLIGIFTDPAVVTSMGYMAEQFIYMLGSVTGSVSSIALTIAQALVGGIATYLQRNAGFLRTMFSSLFTGLGDSFAGVSEIFTSVASIFSVFGSQVGQTFISTLIGVIMNSAGTLATVIVQLIGTALGSIATVISTNTQGIQDVFTGLLEIATVPLQMIETLINETFYAFQECYVLYIQPFFLNLVEGINTIITALLNFYNNSLLPVFSGIATGIQNVWNKYIGPIMDKVLDIIGRVIAIVGELWNNWLAPFISWLISTFGPVFSSVIETVGNIFTTVFEGIMGLIDSVLQALDGLIKFVQGVFTGDWTLAWEGVKDIFKGVWNGIASACETALNFIVDALNFFSFDIPDWIPGIGGSTFGFNLSHVSIPRLATGTVIPPNAGEFAAILGDNNRDTEVVSPLETIKQALAEVMAEYQNQDINLVVNGNMAALVRMLRIELDREDQRKGKRLVTV